MPFVAMIVIVLMPVLMVMVVTLLMHMPVRRHIFILHVVHPTYRALPRLIAAAALAVHGANVGGSILRPLLVGISFHLFTIFHLLCLVSSCVITSGIRIAAAGDDKKGQRQYRQ